MPRTTMVKREACSYGHLNLWLRPLLGQITLFHQVSRGWRQSVSRAHWVTHMQALPTTSSLCVCVCVHVHVCVRPCGLVKGMHVHTLHDVRSTSPTSPHTLWVPYCWSHAPKVIQGLTLIIQTDKKCWTTLWTGFDLYILFALVLDGLTCRRISACLTHSLSVWPPPPSGLPTLSLCLSPSLSPPLLPVFVLIIAKVMWARQSQWIMWLERAQAQTLSSDHSNRLGFQSHLSRISR